MTYPPFKRGVDFLSALLLLLALAPLLGLVALALLATQGRPVFFIQTRPGLQERPFRIIKFRTLERSIESATSGGKSPGVTPLGRILRLLSIDELPQLVNIIRGEMSFVGPRPFLIDYLPFYSPEQRVRHRVRPGLTGLAQVEGRNSVSWERRLELDARYVRELSLTTDARIILRSISLVLNREGIAEPNSQADSRFNAP